MVYKKKTIVSEDGKSGYYCIYLNILFLLKYKYNSNSIVIYFTIDNMI